MSQHQEFTESVEAPAHHQISGLVDGSVVTSLYPDGTILFHVAIGNEPAGGDCVQIVLDGAQAQAVLEAWRHRGTRGTPTMLPAAQCQVGVQRQARWSVDR